MTIQFYFKNFDADEVTRASANAALNRILDVAPYGATSVAILEKQTEGYCCSVDIYSYQGPFMASTVRSNAIEAIQAVEKKLKKQIEFWWSHRRASSQFAESNILQAVA